MKNEFFLVMETLPNHFHPIFINEYVHNLQEIDEFTSQFSKEELLNYLKKNEMIYNKLIDIDFQIVYKDKENIEKIEYGPIYKDDYFHSFSEYIHNFIKENQNNDYIMNELKNKIENDKSISDNIKEFFKVVYDNHYLPYEDLKVILDYIPYFDYKDLRTVYLFIKKNLSTRKNKTYQI